MLAGSVRGENNQMTRTFIEMAAVALSLGRTASKRRIRPRKASCQLVSTPVLLKLEF
jgi:hypothetical protein